ncbi:type II toxin-antitoxin system RelE/ParE family toxin [Bythopirellula polymerisocia]|uniref:Plasmid stabilization system protein n=1 Tax=Bythopirellula polymerisocia TaxID=2528003 RepID=A0A5C6CQ89_9BACT|nr:Plasmid stabilization system protein [Bythopirellula polymerisocia]
MKHRVRLTDEAQRQIETISDFIAIDSTPNANRWLKNLQKRIESLCNSPESHAVLYSAEVAGF